MEQTGITVNFKYQYISLNHTTPLNLSSAFTPLFGYLLNLGLLASYLS